MYKNKISIMGTGYVGLVGGVCLADFGNNIVNVDVDEDKIEKLKRGEVPIYEQGLKELLQRNLEDERINFTTDAASAIEESEVIFIAVGTPPADDGSADISGVLDVARQIGRNMDGYRVVVDKSTVPIGTGRRVEAVIEEELDERGLDYDFDVVSNPEFLREGKAVHDFTNPDRVVIGTESEKARDILTEVYRPLFMEDVPFVFTNLETAEMIKYASNAFLATKISFINEISRLCEKVNADVKKVAQAMGLDDRIANRFLRAGPGYGGSCFPKDTRAIVNMAREKGVDMDLIEAGISVNEEQKQHMAAKIVEELGEDLTGRTLGFLGLSFKPETDDMRESPALTILPELIERGASIKAYDPEAMEEAAECFQEYECEIVYCADAYDVMKNSDAVVLLTEWNQFRRLDFERVKRLLDNPVFFDLRNVYQRDEVEPHGLKYIAVGLPDSRSRQEMEKLINEVEEAAVSG